MVIISNNVIRVTQGDTLETPVEIYTEDGEQYVPASTDVIRFALKSSYSDSEPLILKTIDTESLVLRLEAEETKQLPAREQEYVYDIELTTEDGTVDTFIAEKQFFVTKEVY